MTISSRLNTGFIVTCLIISLAAVASESTQSANKAPTADAGLGSSVVVGENVTLDASGSTDLDGDRLKFYWSLSAPRGSGARLNDQNALRPQFTVDLLGDYTATLVVDDGQLKSATDTVKISTGNVAPVAIVDKRTNIDLGATVVLDGSASWDFNGDPLTFKWALVEAPSGSRASLQASRSASPNFSPDIAGDYRIELTVNDGHFDSETIGLWLYTNGSQPHIEAGRDRSVYTGTQFKLAAETVTHSSGKPLTYQWHLLHAPATSRAILDESDSAGALFRADVSGLYLIQLTAHDTVHASSPDTVVITAYDSTAQVFATTQLGGSDVDGDGILDDIDNCAEHFNPSQLDTNGDGFGNRCDADLDNDGFITNFGDFVIWSAAFLSSPGSANWNPDADFNGDSAVNFSDLFIFQAFFLGAPGPIVNRFINPAGGTWHDGANWSLGVVPNTTHSARIDIGSGVVVDYSTGSSEIETLRSSTDVTFTGGSLTINGDMQVDGDVTLSGSGTIARAKISAPTTQNIMMLEPFETFTFEDVTLGADVNIGAGGQLRVNNDLTLNGGATITLASDNNFTYLRFVGVSGTSSTLGGNGEVVFGGTTAVNNRNSIEVFNSLDGLVVESGVTIRTGTTGGTIDHRFSNGPITIRGEVIADGADRSVTLDANLLTIDGTLQVSNSALLDVFFRTSIGAITSSALLTVSSGGELQLRGDWVNEGTISVSDATLDIGSLFTDQWENLGAINLSNATLELGGSFIVADIGNVTGTGIVILDGSLDNSGMALDTGVDLPGTSVELGAGGIILGGSVINTPIVVPPFISFTFENVTLGADLTISAGGQLRVHDDLTLDNSIITLASDNNFTYLRFLGQSGNGSTLGGNGEVIFGGTTAVDTRNSIEVFHSLDELVIGSGVTIRSGTAGGTIDHRFNNGPITINGTVISNLAGRSITIDTNPLTISGNFQVSDSALLDIFFRGSDGVITSSALLSAASGGELGLRGNWVNEGSITVTNATLDIGNLVSESWDNNGTITIDNATLELGGSYTLADIGTVTGTGTVILNGSFDNLGTTLNPAVDFPGTTFELGNGGILLGGSVVGTPIELLPFVTFTFDNVLLGADLTISAGGQLRVNDDLTLDGATITLASDNNFTYLRFLGESGTSSTLGGTGEVVFGGTTTVDNRNTIEVFNSLDGLVVEAGITIRSDTTGGTIDHRFNNGPITIHGTVISNLASRSIIIDANPLTINGNLQVSNSALLDLFFRDGGGLITSSATLSVTENSDLKLRGDWVSEGTITITDSTLEIGNLVTENWNNNGTIVLSNATLELGGNYTVADIGTVTGTGTVILTGILDNTGMTLDVGADLPGTSVELGDGGTLLGGSVVNAPLTLPNFVSYTFDNVILGTDLMIGAGGQLRVTDDLTLSGGATITLASDNNFTYLRFLGESGTSSTLSGNGEVVFAGTTTLSNRNSIEVFNSLDGLVVEAGITIRTGTSGGTVDTRFNNGAITMNGTVISDLDGRSITIDADPLTVNGNLQASNLALIDLFFRGASGTINSSALLSATTDSEMQLRGNWINEGSISVTDATLDLGNLVTETWDNNGVITMSNATLELGGSYSVANIGNATGTGTVVVNGSLDNTGATLDTGADLPGTAVELGDGGIVLGGTVINTALVIPDFASFTLDNVTLGADLTVSRGGQLRIHDDLTLSGGATVTLASDNNFTYLRFLGVSATNSTLSGNGEIVFGGTTSVDNRNNIEVNNSLDSLVVESGVTIRTGTSGGNIDHRFNNGSITIQGTIISDLPTRSITIGAAPLSIQGTLQAGAGGTVNFTSDYTLSATGALDVDIGGTTTASYGRFTASSHVANLDGTLNITLVNAFVPALSDTFDIMTFNSRTGTFATENGTDINGSLFFQVNYNTADVMLEVTN